MPDKRCGQEWQGWKGRQCVRPEGHRGTHSVRLRSVDYTTFLERRQASTRGLNQEGVTMGTNYYVDGLGPDPDSGESQLHIGKSSSGWVFHFHEVMFGEAALNSTRAWYKFLARVKIVDEYGKAVTREELFDLIERKRNTGGLHEGARLDPEGQMFSRGEFC